MKIFIVLAVLFSCFTNIYAGNLEQSTNNYFNRIKKNSKKLYLFLLKMPKGGDLHYHLDGGSYAENLFLYAIKSKKCINISLGKVDNCTSKSYIPFYDIRKNSKK